ncbi:DofB protein [Stigmatella sp. ncwal1]|uniref:DofB protein n=1 Tax=Stigmatella ashevillensis TaxID=2995309 RepID=A0ABT5DE16_9BACT|nr:DofB protein [Stigmatella ashevillena]MDC0711925.1 DofB protein [Stigmatella ashevillena]
MGLGFKAGIIDRVFFARYLRPPTRDDVAQVHTQLAEARESLGRPLIYVASIEATVKVPNLDERSNLNNLLATVRKYCEVVHLVIEGSELQNSLQRVIISGMLIVTRTYDDGLAVHKNVASTTADLSERLQRDAAPLIQEARDRGLVL